MPRRLRFFNRPARTDEEGFQYAVEHAFELADLVSLGIGSRRASGRANSLRYRYY